MAEELEDRNIADYTKYGGKANHDNKVPWKTSSYKYGVLNHTNWLFKAMFDSLEWGEGEEKSAFEVGCGFGRNLRMLSDDLGDDILLAGCDITPTQIDFANSDYLKDYPNIKRYINCGAEIPEKDNSYAVVYTVTVLQHVIPEKFDDIVDEICRISSSIILHLENGQSILKRTGKTLEDHYAERGYTVDKPEIQVWSEPENCYKASNGLLFVVSENE